MIQKITPYIFAFTLFVSAMLVFSVQPMLGKMMLPHVGGAPSGWAVTMFFFQTCLLFGYGLAYIFSKLPPFLNILAILFIFIPAALFLPIAYKSGIVDSISPWAVFLQLTASTAVPFLALSTLAPALQRIFSFSTHSTAGDPYYLYAASNLGSFVGLLAYPFILEPLIGLQAQSHAWMVVFTILFFSIIICAISIFSTRRDLINLKLKFSPSEKTALKDEKITWSRRLKWLCLAAIPSSLMIGTTTEITTDIASAPMIWVIPLSLYLLTNIIAFGKKYINTDALSIPHILSILAILVLLIFSNNNTDLNKHTALLALLYMATFTVTALLLHALLASDRPSPSKLTEFYLIMALGGAIGGSFNAFIAPVIFNDIYEFQFILILSLLFNPSFQIPLPPSMKKIGYGVLGMIVVILAFSITNPYALSFLVFAIIFSAIHPKLLFACAILTLLFLATPLSQKYVSYVDRNFFGVLKILRINLSTSSEQKITAKTIQHGTTLHGFEADDPAHAYKPYSYYSATGPVGDAINNLRPEKIAVLGLGVGQMACYKKPGREFTFYEINPQVVDLALKEFSILKNCGYADIIIGDARLELQKDKNSYDIIAVDTFSSDSIPIHLITKEAIELYMSKLNPKGTILINISNRHLDLRNPLASIAKDLDYIYRSKAHNPPKDDYYTFASEWVVITKNKKFIKSLDNDWKPFKTKAQPWTDDYSNFISTLKMLHKNNE